MTRKKAKKQTARRSKMNEPAIVAVAMGTATRIEYIHAIDGKHYFHDFKGKKRPTLCRTRDGSKLILSPVEADTFIR